MINCISHWVGSALICSCQVTNIINFISYLFSLYNILMPFLVRITSLIYSPEQFHDLTSLQLLSNYCILNNCTGQTTQHYAYNMCCGCAVYNAKRTVRKLYQINLQKYQNKGNKKKRDPLFFYIGVMLHVFETNRGVSI